MCEKQPHLLAIWSSRRGGERYVWRKPSADSVLQCLPCTRRDRTGIEATLITDHTMDTKHYDLIVFGGGNAISTAIYCGAKGMRVALVEKGPLGGTCPHRGCIPSKLLIGYADAAEEARDAERFGFETTVRTIDPNAILRDTFDFTKKYDGILERALGENVTLYRHKAVFTSNRTLQINDTSISADKLVLATGSRPERPALNVPYWTSDEIFELHKMPKSITIVGGGYIACELGHFFHGIGVDTLIVVRGSQLLDREDAETRAVFMKGFTERVSVRFNSTIASVAHDGSLFHITMRHDDGAHSRLDSEALLFCIGRVPNSDNIGIQNTDLKPTARGYVETDDHLRTSVEGVYAMGDIAGRYMFTHAANFESEYLGNQIADKCDEPIDYGPMPHAVFTSPEIASVGATEEELKKSSRPYLAASVPFMSTTKGRAVKEEHGLCKLLIAPDHKILGCHIVGYQASVLLHAVLPIMKWRNDVHSLVDIIYIHPSLAEVVRGAARKAAGMLPTSCRDMEVARLHC
jgi:mycothione reductase